MAKYLDGGGLSHLIGKIKNMFTANVHITDENIDLSTTPSSGIYHRVIQIDDANGDCIGWVQAHQDENGAHGISIGTHDLNDPDGTTHQIMLSMNGSTPGCWVSQAASVRSGIGAAASSHSHGNITSGGDITAAAPAVASGDRLIINDESASKVTNGPAFGNSTSTFLRNDGTWATPARPSITLDDLVLDAFDVEAGFIVAEDGVADLVGYPLPQNAGGTGTTTPVSSTTATRNTTYTSAGSVTLYKRYGNVYIQGNLTTRTISARSTVATAPTGYRPPAQFYVPINSYNAYLTINSDGTIQADSTVSAKTIYFSGSWPAA